MIKTIKHQEKANFILDKGIDVLWRNGYHGTSVNDIVKEAEVPKGSFYFYFNSKEDFTVQALDKYFKMMFSPMRQILEDTSITPKKRLLQFYKLRAEIMIEEMDCKHGCMANNLGNEMSEHSEKIRKTILQFENEIKSLITSIFIEGQDANEIDTSFEAVKIVNLIEDAGKGAMITMKEKQNSESLDNLLFFVNNLFLK